MNGIRVAVLVVAAGVGTASLAGMNPGNPGFPRTDLFGVSFDNNHYSAMCIKCHDRNPSARTPTDNTGLGSHFVYGGGSLATQNLSPEKLTAWPTTNALSRYGKIGDNVSVTGVQGEILCESCHNMIRNTGTHKLVAADNATTDPSPLCEGCHGKTGAGHHLLTGETSELYNRALRNADSLFVRNPPVSGSEATYPGADAVNCRSCHKPHDAQTKGGARILKRGFRAVSNPGDPVDGVGTTGIERQHDIDPAGANRLVTDFTALCDACHKASD